LILITAVILVALAFFLLGLKVDELEQAGILVRFVVEILIVGGVQFLWVWRIPLLLCVKVSPLDIVLTRSLVAVVCVGCLELRVAGGRRHG